MLQLTRLLKIIPNKETTTAKMLSGVNDMPGVFSVNS